MEGVWGILALLRIVFDVIDVLMSKVVPKALILVPKVLVLECPKISIISILLPIG